MGPAHVLARSLSSDDFRTELPFSDVTTLIDRLVLAAEGRRAVLDSQFAVQLDDVGERLYRRLWDLSFACNSR